jgi:hypothetical protein
MSSREGELIVNQDPMQQNPGGYPAYPPAQQPYPSQYPQQPMAGYPPAYPAAPMAAPSTNGFAIASLVCSIIGISLLGVIFGHVALSQINRSGGMSQGKGLAIAGLIIGYIGIAFALLWIVFFIIAAIAAGGTTTPSTTPFF